MLELVDGTPLQGGGKGLEQQGHIVGMDALRQQAVIRRRGLRRFEPVNSVLLVGPNRLLRRDVVFKRAQMRDLLSLGQPVLRFPQDVLRPLAGGDVDKQAGELPGSGAEGRHLKILVQIAGVVFEGGRFAGQRHSAVGLDPVRLGARQDFQHGLAHDGVRLQAGQPLEGRVDGQEAVIDRPASRVADHLVQGETVQHVFEEGLIAFLGLLALGDVQDHGEATDDPVLGIAHGRGQDLRDPTSAARELNRQFQRGNRPVFRHGPLQRQLGLAKFLPVEEVAHAAPQRGRLRRRGGNVVLGRHLELGPQHGIAGDVLAGRILREADAHGQGLQQRLQPLVGGEQAPFGLLARGDVLHEPMPEDAAVRLAHRPGMTLHPNLLPVRAPPPELVPPGGQAPGRSGDAGPNPVEVVRVEGRPQRGGGFGQVFRRQAEELQEGRVGVRATGAAVRPQAEGKKAAGHGGDELGERVRFVA